MTNDAVADAAKGILLLGGMITLSLIGITWAVARIDKPPVVSVCFTVSDKRECVSSLTLAEAKLIRKALKSTAAKHIQIVLQLKDPDE